MTLYLYMQCSTHVYTCLEEYINFTYVLLGMLLFRLRLPPLNFSRIYNGRSGN